jgi:hypothetical protein
LIRSASLRSAATGVLLRVVSMIRERLGGHSRVDTSVGVWHAARPLWTILDRAV